MSKIMAACFAGCKIPRCFSRALIVGVAFFVLFLAAPVGAAGGLQSGQSVDIWKSIILPAVRNIELASADDPNLISWLKLLKLRSPLVSDVGPAAFATMDNGLPVVQVDALFVLKCSRASDFAGLMMAGPSGDTVFTAGKLYGMKVSESILKGENPPSIGVDLDSLNMGPSDRVAAEYMSQLAFGSAIQWVILHEIGHHQLNHFYREPENNAESREWELAADTWAIRKMQVLGYSLHPLSNVMATFLVEDEIKKLGGLATPVAISTHPSWGQRADNLGRFNVDKPSRFGNFINVVELSAEPSSGKVFANEMLIPRRPMPGVLAQYRQFGRIVQMPAEFFADGSIHLFGRTAAELSEIVISNHTSLYPDITFRYKNVITGKVSESHTRGYQSDMASLMSQPTIEIRSFNIRDVMLMDPVTIFKKRLMTVENRPKVIQQAMKTYEQSLSEFNSLLLMYAKGTLNLQAAQKMALSLSTDRANEMKQLLGDDRYRMLQEKILSDPGTARALEKLVQ